MSLHREQIALERLQRAVYHLISTMDNHPFIEVLKGSETTYDKAFATGYDVALKTVLNVLEDKEPGDLIREYYKYLSENPDEVLNVLVDESTGEVTIKRQE